MEYIKGITLYEFMNNLHKKKIKFINKIFDILKYKTNMLHKLGYLHNDLHSGNIILKFINKKFIDLYIIDYGLSKSINNMDSFNITRYWENNKLIFYLIYIKKYIKININEYNINIIGNIYKKTSDNISEICL